MSSRRWFRRRRGLGSRLTSGTRALLALGTLAGAVLAYACTLTDIVSVEVIEVQIHPPSATLIEGETFQFTPRASDHKDPSATTEVVYMANDPMGAVSWGCGWGGALCGTVAQPAR